MNDIIGIWQTWKWRSAIRYFSKKGYDSEPFIMYTQYKFNNPTTDAPSESEEQDVSEREGGVVGEVSSGRAKAGACKSGGN